MVWRRKICLVAKEDIHEEIYVEEMHTHELRFSGFVVLFILFVGEQDKVSKN